MAGRLRIMFGAFLLFLMMAATQAHAFSFVLVTDAKNAHAQAFDDRGRPISATDIFGMVTAIVEVDPQTMAAMVTTDGQRFPAYARSISGNIIAVEYQDEAGAGMISVFLPENHCFVTVHRRAPTGRGFVYAAPCTASNWQQ